MLSSYKSLSGLLRSSMALGCGRINFSIKSINLLYVTWNIKGSTERSLEVIRNI